ncbi:MAG: SCO family protein [Rhodospirillales bacterium]|nr:SCO family protein [Rhodospirillales bacterium]
MSETSKGLREPRRMQGPKYLQKMGPVIGLALLALAAPLPVSAHHTLKQKEEALRYRENYLELTDRVALTFRLKDADGQTVRLEDFKGKVIILNFVFAACTDVCPLHSDLIGRLQGETKALRDKLQFITITTHPEFDTAEILKPYGAIHGLDPKNWMFLTSGPERPTETRELAESYGVKFTPVGNGQFVHGVVTHVIDQNGVLRARYHGLKFNLMNLIVHVNTLISEYH